MRISVIIPTRNRPSGLQQAVKSVLAQTRLPLEIIVVDDGSEPPVDPNSLIDLCNKTLVEIRVWRHDVPQGASVARNKGVELARGEIIMFLDDDDTWEPSKIEKQLEIFLRNPRVGLVYSGRLVVSESNRSEVLYQIPPRAEGHLYPQILYDNLIGTTSSVAIFKTVFLEADGFDPRLPALEDYDLWIRCARITEIAHDGCCYVRYTVAINPRKQISGRGQNHIIATNLLLEKYGLESKAQGRLAACRIRSAFYFFVAKAFQKESYWAMLQWCFKSLIMFPSFRALALLMPPAIVTTLRRWRGR